MSKSTTRPDKRTDDGSIRRELSYHSVPADWVQLGRHEAVLENRDRFYAEKVCYEYRLEPDPNAVGGVAEKHTLIVLYRKPGTNDAVQRTYRASVFESDADGITTTTSDRDGPYGRGNWGTVDYHGIKPNDGTVVVPRTVREGEPRNFRASVAVHEDTPRVDEGRL